MNEADISRSDGTETDRGPIRQPHADARAAELPLVIDALDISQGDRDRRPLTWHGVGRESQNAVVGDSDAVDAGSELNHRSENADALTDIEMGVQPMNDLVGRRLLQTGSDLHIHEAVGPFGVAGRGEVTKYDGQVELYLAFWT